MSARGRAGDGQLAVLWAGAGAAWIACSFLPATSSGLGSTLSSHQLADLVQSGTVSAWVPTWIGVAWYIVPVSGALLVICSALEGAAARAARVFTSAAATFVSLALSLSVTRWSPSRFGPATWLSIAAAAIAASALMIPMAPSFVRVKRRRDR